MAEEIREFTNAREAAEYVANQFDEGKDTATVKLQGVDAADVVRAVARLRPERYPSIVGSVHYPTRTFSKPLNW